MKRPLFSLFVVMLMILPLSAHEISSHGEHVVTDVTEPRVQMTQQEFGTVHYLGNEALLVVSHGQKILFDPFFHHNLNIYQLVPEKMKADIFNGVAPFDQIDAIFISHAHRDHFAADDMVKYLNKHINTKLFASKQTISQLKAYAEEAQLVLNQAQLHEIELSYGDPVWKMAENGLKIQAVRIPHAGWPSRAEVENLIFNVTLASGASVMHMGDADPDDDHYLPYKPFWQSLSTDVNFPPYWFFLSAEGRDILTEIIAATENIGIHVPMQVPPSLERAEAPFFHLPGDVYKIKNKK